jgi:hypothetical protein
MYDASDRAHSRCRGASDRPREECTELLPQLPMQTIVTGYALMFGPDQMELLRQAIGCIDHPLFVIEQPNLFGAERLQDKGLMAQVLMQAAGH